MGVIQASFRHFRPRKNRPVGYGRGAANPRDISRHHGRFPGTCEIPAHRTLRDDLFRVALSQALRARLRSHRPSGIFRNNL
jgi:hypothetical protein